MGFWMTFFISLALTVVGEILRPKQKFNNPKPSGLGDFQFPTADASRVIPWFWGTCKLQGPNTTWFGDLKVVAITKRVKTGWFSKTTITQGFKYYLGVQLVYGFGPMDRFVLQMDDKTVYTSSGAAGAGDVWAFNIDFPSLLGNDDPKNGVSGPVKVYKGTFTQTGNEYLRQQWGEIEVSAFRPLVQVVLEHCYLGNSDTPPPVTLIATRVPNPLGLAAGRFDMNGDANAANMCYEVMTDMIGGMKISPSLIGIDSFQDCAETIFIEGLGLSMTVDTAMVGRALLAEILRHVDGVIYPDPVTGLYTMKLARDDYVLAELPAFDASNIAPEGFEFSRISWEDTKNTTIVNYMDRASGFNVKPVNYQDLANVFARGGQIDSEQIDFLGFSNATTAMRAAARANKTRSSPLARAQFNTDRSGYMLRPGSVLTVTRADHNLVDLVCRVVDISYGTLDDPRVQVTTTEDIFAVNSFAYEPPDTTGWEPPSGLPVALAAQRLVEAPHFGAPHDRPYVFTFASRGGAFEMWYEVWSDPTGGTAYTQTETTPDFTPSGLLTAAYPMSATAVDAVGFTIGSVIDVGRIVQGPTGSREDGTNLLMIDDEIMAWSTIVDNGNGTHTIQGVIRGALDTVPATHAINARVWFFSEGVGVTDPEGYGVNTTVNVKVLPANSRGTLPIASAINMSLTTVSRSLKPSPPGRIRVNTVHPLNVVGTVTGTFTLSWAHRNRNGNLVVSQDALSDVPEANTLYNVRFYNGGSLIYQKDGMNATTAQVGLVFSGSLRIELETVRDGLVSIAKQSHVITYAQGSVTVNSVVPDAPVYILDGGGA